MSENETHFEIVELVEIQGSLVSYDPLTGALMLAPVVTASGFSFQDDDLKVGTNQVTRYEDSEAQEICSADFFITVSTGESVSVQGRFNDQIFMAEKVSLLPRRES